MNITLNILMLLIAGVFGLKIFSSINKSSFLLVNTGSWIIISVVLILFAVFPAVPMALSKLLGFETTSNFLVLFAVIGLLLNAFTTNITLSKQQNEIKRLVQELSIMKSEGKKEE